MKITGIFAAGVISGLSLHLGPEDGRWVSGKDVEVGNLIVFEDETVGYIINIRNNKAKVVPVNTSQPITNRHLEMYFIVFAKAAKEGRYKPTAPKVVLNFKKGYLK